MLSFLPSFAWFFLKKIKLGQKNFHLKIALCLIIYNTSSKFVNLVFIWVKFRIIMNGLDSIITSFLQVQLWRSVTSIKTPCQVPQHCHFLHSDRAEINNSKKKGEHSLNDFTSLLPLGGAFEQCNAVGLCADTRVHCSFL